MSKQKMKQTSLSEELLPPIPEKMYFSIGEVAQLCNLKPHVLRYWEQEFPRLNPSKRKGNRRYYQYHDVMMVRKIKNLLYDQGYTIEGARQRLSETKESMDENIRILLRNTISSLEELLIDLKK